MQLAHDRFIEPGKTFHNAAGHGRGAASSGPLPRRLRRSWAPIPARPVPDAMGCRTGRKHRGRWVALGLGLWLCKVIGVEKADSDGSTHLLLLSITTDLL